jgi:hypothetical protein
MSLLQLIAKGRPSQEKFEVCGKRRTQFVFFPLTM